MSTFSSKKKFYWFSFVRWIHVSVNGDNSLSFVVNIILFVKTQWKPCVQSGRQKQSYLYKCMQSVVLRGWKQTQNHDYSNGIHLAKTKSMKYHKLWIFYDRNLYHSVSKQKKNQMCFNNSYSGLSIMHVLVLMVSSSSNCTDAGAKHSLSPQLNRPIMKLLPSQKMLSGLIMKLRSLPEMLKALLLTS